VLFGINAVTQLIDKEDAHATPVDIKQPGVDIQATILDNYLTTLNLIFFFHFREL